MKGNRPSSLDVSLYCPAAARLANGAAGRAAYISTVYHARAAGDPRWVELARSLTTEEHADLEARKLPTDIAFPDGRTLVYAEGIREYRIGLDARLAWCDPDDPAVLTAGTCDVHWPPLDGVLYLADLKARERTSHVGSLQLHCYGWALASRYGAFGYCPGIWAATEGTWQWGNVVYLDTLEAWDVEAQLRRAITNTDGPACTGPHCDDCWQQLRCPEYLLPAIAVTQTPLAGLEAPEQLTNDQVCQLVRLRTKLEALREAIGVATKAWVRANGPARDAEAGKVWCGRERAGRESVSVAELREALGPDAERFIKRGASYPHFDWYAAPRGPKGPKKKRLGTTGGGVEPPPGGAP